VNHLPFVASAYALGILVPVAFAAAAWARTRRAERRLAALDTRTRREARP
jgi:cytochrome c biogenesis protein CcdA